MSTEEFHLLRLYDYASSANCYKVRLLLAHLGLEYERVAVDIFGGDTLNPDYGRKNPALRTPVLEYAPERYLSESAAILLYLAEGTDLLPSGREQRAQVHRWLFFEQSSILPTLALLRFQLLTGRASPDSDGTKRRQGTIAALLTTVDGELADSGFAVDDDFSVADIALYGYVHVAEDAGVDTGHLRHLNAWLERVRSQPNHVDDLQPYPDNARPGQGQSIYDFVGV